MTAPMEANLTLVDTPHAHSPAFGDGETAMMGRAFDLVWHELEGEQSIWAARDQAEECRKEIALILMQLMRSGSTDVGELRDRTLTEFRRRLRAV